MELLLEVLLAPLVACLVLMGIHTYLGLHVVSRGVIFVDLALAQIAAMGATFAFLIGYDPRGTSGYLYSLLFAFIGAGIFSVLRLRKQRIPKEAIIGITFAVASSASIIIADRAPEGAEFVEAMLTGSLLWVTWPVILTTALVYAGIGFFHWYFRRRFLTVSLEPERAETEGWSVRWWDFLFYTSFGLMITYSVPIAGILLVFSFLIIPSVIAMLYARTIAGRLAIGWGVGTAVSMVGLALSYVFDFPSGPAVVCTFGMALILAGMLRYLLSAEQFLPAAAKMAATTALVVGGFWLAFATSPLSATAEDADVENEPAVQQEAATGDPTQRANAAVTSLEASTGVPPAEAVEALIEVRDDIHRLMQTGLVKVSESAVVALARAPEDGALSELLEEIAYHAGDPWARLRGAEGLLTRRNVLGVEPLIELMESDQPVFLQLQAVDVLRQATGENFGYDPQGDAAAKTTAVQKWHGWWEAHKAEPLPEGSNSSPQGR
ncbi:MAG: iron chelate uptake ABC transporter family permease subunit [Acidobacteriota bacterium]